MHLAWCMLHCFSCLDIWRDFLSGSLPLNYIKLWFSKHTHMCVRVCQRRSVKLDFLPETYRLDEPKDREKFTEVFKGTMCYIPVLPRWSAVESTVYGCFLGLLGLPFLLEHRGWRRVLSTVVFVRLFTSNVTRESRKWFSIHQWINQSVNFYCQAYFELSRQHSIQDVARNIAKVKTEWNFVIIDLSTEHFEKVIKLVVDENFTLICTVYLM